VLNEERTTWQALCEQMPEAPIAAHAKEEMAPERVPDRPTGYGPATAAHRHSAPSAFSIEA
jgi:hypothetical protein